MSWLFIFLLIFREMHLDCMRPRRKIYVTPRIPRWINGQLNPNFEVTPSRVFIHSPPTCILDEYPGLSEFLGGVGNRYSRIVLVPVERGVLAEIFNANGNVIGEFPLDNLSSEEIVEKLEMFGITPDLDENDQIIPEKAIPQPIHVIS
ncbi:uncharacterized protein MONOS_4452 [Monocercomonoides exilis]|uniref:uncharacterized protein n=1 Tax=Monocercomonoides exilis TaxID=2049356 RepID=UPI00355AA507|nr:hypothetical protein MONOS_4452 [Monocercomonoides exilis]|eukprot:MONOS_4452.1-p1 / transcript=MONOS_4452.1 / gene=MONOS_4452 / organism=Monocercomonoides_exilis_PA203 / gene_product=unspecified product / transcript_product=unspecified product / location=Mono_scaffold00118:81269-81922(-) / protein_length=148 / sequence_SO=supercontig / SO=protein_coding / is_pseudo=false